MLCRGEEGAHGQQSAHEGVGFCVAVLSCQAHEDCARSDGHWRWTGLWSGTEEKACEYFVAEATTPAPSVAWPDLWLPSTRTGNKELTVFHVTCGEHIFLLFLGVFLNHKLLQVLSSTQFPVPVLVCDLCKQNRKCRPSGPEN